MNKMRLFENHNWEEIVLANALSKDELIRLIDHYGFKFTDPRWTSFSQSEIARTFIVCPDFDKEHSDIKNSVEPYLVKNDLLTYNEARQVYKALEVLDKEVLIKIYKSISKNQDLLKMVLDVESREDFSKEDIVTHIFEELYDSPK